MDAQISGGLFDGPAIPIAVAIAAVILAYQLYSGRAYRRPFTLVTRAEQPGAYWTQVLANVVFIVIFLGLWARAGCSLG